MEARLDRPEVAPLLQGQGCPARDGEGRGKQLKARRLSFTWQMHNSQGSPGDQICPTGNSTPLSSREQPGQGTAGEKGRVGRSAEEGPECPRDLQRHPARTDRHLCSLTLSPRSRPLGPELLPPGSLS